MLEYVTVLFWQDSERILPKETPNYKIATIHPESDFSLLKINLLNHIWPFNSRF